jgi:two-component system sensor histidine kinase YesM
MKLFGKSGGRVPVKSLQAQLIFTITLCSLVVLAAGTYMTNRYTRNILEKNNERYLLQQFHQADGNIGTVIADVDRLSKIFVSDDDIQRFLEQNYDMEDFGAYELTEAIFGRIDDFSSDYSAYKPYSYINSIYIYTENKGCIGGNERHSVLYRDEADTAEFFSSDFYREIKEAFPQLVLSGGITEAFYRNYEEENQPYIISIAREIKPTREQNLSASLIFNVDERYIASIYANTGDIGAGKMSILDRSGRVISSSDTQSIGKVDAVAAQIDPGKVSGSAILRSGLPAQVVYSKLTNTDWYLVGEIPLSFLTRDMAVLQRVSLFVFLASLLVIFVVTYFWLKRITGPLSTLARKMRDTGRGELGLVIEKVPEGNEIGVVIRRFNEMSMGIKELVRKQEEIEGQKRELEIEALQAQINPHFLYNTLNMIKWMAAIIKARNIVDCIVALGNILQPVFGNSEAMFTLEEEIVYLENYIKIVNWRFDNRVHFEFAVEEGLPVCKVPRFILQPIVENSIAHGLSEQAGGIRISIDAEMRGADLAITVADTGRGMPEDKLAEINAMLENGGAVPAVSGGSGRIGIANVHRRVRLNFGPRYGIRIESEEGKGTKVEILVPAVK